ncbi:flotillin family protein [Beggiatoa leptomitoformis]|uniref:Flotillin family protein n=1 Tax=Beggiatoa leptomitoformis TaxID=288004 RepID=A0A2N9YDI4_9GAMM|nr:flotillin family protein [Beggiatoa leptomitoformis]ALG69073.1 flotillin family protein [Beggiatoa leptomitoformis]AUI68516.1 flotillin family protein [Beggiatoa leptomitoformis]
MSLSIGLVLTTILLLALIIFGVLFLIFHFFKKVEQGKALIVNTMKSEPIVTFTGRMVLPVVHKAEIMDISLKTIEIDRRGREGLICKDNIRADIKVTFFVRVNKTPEDVLRVAQSIGCARASDQKTLEELFIAKFSEALKTVGKQLDFEDLYKERDSFRDKIIELIGTHLNGYVLEDAAIDYLEQTPLTDLDPSNILDSQGIRKITELTANQNVLTNEFKNQEKMKITKQNVEAKEAILELERQQADAEARQTREIQNVRDREQAEMTTIAEQERLRAETARKHTEEQLAIQEENKQREIEVAGQNRLRVVSIEAERVKLAQEQEIVGREREIELQRIEKEKALEEQRRDIAHVIRERVAVEKTVAEEEERTKELRVLAEANRQKQVKIINAEAIAQEVLVTDIKAAEASHEAAKFKALEKITLADAERDTADKLAMAKIRLAEGVQAEQAASGLANVKVKEANALAIEREGVAQAKALLERLQAEATGEEQKGLAQTRVRDAQIVLIEKDGAAQAKALLDKLQAEASGDEQKGLSQARVKEAMASASEKQGMVEVKIKEADAQAIEKLGIAEAKALQEHLLAEATGLAEKFKSLDALSETGKVHEEFRLRMEQQLQVEKLRMDAQKVTAEMQAAVLGEALKTAKIDIIGGDSRFFEQIISATSMAKAVDGFVENSQTTQQLFKNYLAENAQGDLTVDLKAILSNPAFSSQDLQNLSLAAFLSKLISHSSPEQQGKLTHLLQAVKKMGVGETHL